jgi:hypothetical protein
MTNGYNPIVQVNVSVQQAPAPSTLQRNVAFISQGATNLAAGTYSLLTVASSLTPLLSGALSLTGITQSAGTATATAAAPHGYTIGDQVFLIMTGGTGSSVAYNGAFICTATTTTQFTYPVPGGTPATGVGTFIYTPQDVAELVAMNTTFFAQGSAASVYVLELGILQPTLGPTELQTWITANPGVFYAYLVPRLWCVLTSFYTLAANYTSPTAKTYFHLTTTLAYWQANPSSFATTLKSVIASIEAPAVAAAAVSGTATEFSAAAFFYSTANLNPNAGIPVTQAAYTFLYGVTPYPVAGNSALFASLKTANINYVGTGAEGGLASNLIEFYGKTLDGNDFNKFWFSIDNVQINLELNTANAIINGSNNTLAPLNYNQSGVNTLQAVAGQTMQSEIGLGLALGALVLTQMTAANFAAAVANGQFIGQVVVNAVPFQSYVTLNPTQYPLGVYGGLYVAYTVQLGFEQIIYNITASTFA